MPDKFTSEDLDQLATKLAELFPGSAGNSSAELEKLAKRAVSIREIVGLIIVLIATISGGSITYMELKAKPTTGEVEATIEVTVEPIRKTANETADKVDKLKPRVDRVEKVQGYQIESIAWQGDVIEHIGQKTPGKPPKKPESLKKQERELLSR